MWRKKTFKGECKEGSHIKMIQHVHWGTQKCAWKSCHLGTKSAITHKII